MEVFLAVTPLKNLKSNVKGVSQPSGTRNVPCHGFPPFFCTNRSNGIVGHGFFLSQSSGVHMHRILQLVLLNICRWVRGTGLAQGYELVQAR